MAEELQPITTEETKEEAKPAEFGFEENDPLHRKEIEDALIEYERQVAGLPRLDELKAPEYLSMSLEILRRKTPEELSEAEFAINQYALKIQMLINRSRSWERWAKSKLDEISASYLPEVQSRFGPYERTQIAKNSPPLCKKLNGFIRQVGMQAERLCDIPNQLRMMADSIRGIKIVAMKREKDYEKNPE